jgi:hypothetical protein
VTVAARMEPLQAMNIAYFPAWFVGFEGKPQFRIGDRNLAFRYRTGSPLGELPLPAQSRGKLWRQRGEKLPLGFTLSDQAHISQQLRFAVQRLAVSLFINAKDCALVRIP